VVVRGQSHPGPQRVELPSRIQMLDLAQGGNAVEVRALAVGLRPEKDEGEQQRQDGTGAHSRTPTRKTFPAAHGCASDGPASACRNLTMAGVSSSVGVRPSWYLNITRTASSSVRTVPSCMYGALSATLRRLGTLKTWRSASRPVTR